MKKNKSILVVILAFVLLLGGAYVLYGKLSQDITPDQLSVQNNAPSQENADNEDSAPSQENTDNKDDTPTQENTDNGNDSSQDTETAEPEKVLAPDFTVYDREGNEVHLSDYVGKPVVLNFWASWCGPCQSEMPDFNEAYAELGEDIHFLMVNMTTSYRESFEKATALIDEQGYSFPVFYDIDSDAATTYGVYSLPMTLFIDAEGYGVAQATGAIDRETLQRGIDLIT